MVEQWRTECLTRFSNFSVRAVHKKAVSLNDMNFFREQYFNQLVQDLGFFSEKKKRYFPIVFTTYSKIRAENYKMLLSIPFTVVALDEGHNIKNRFITTLTCVF